MTYHPRDYTPTGMKGSLTVKTAQVDFAACQACAVCTAKTLCRTKAIIKMGKYEQAVVKPSDCMGCGDCIDGCPHGAVSMTGR